MAPRSAKNDPYIIEGVGAEELCPVHGRRRMYCGCGLPSLVSSTTDEVPDAAHLVERRAQESRVLAEASARSVAVFTRNDSFWDAFTVAQKEAAAGRRAWIEFQSNEDGTLTAACVMSQAAA